MKRPLNILLALLILSTTSCTSMPVSAQKQHPIDYVNMLIGTTGEHPTEYGGTTPAVSEPFGMTQWCATTRINGISKTMYHANDSDFIGFMATHQPAVWMGDYGFFTLMPQVDSLKLSAEDRAVKLDRAKEIATPYYYKLSYAGASDKEITTELTATSRSAFFKIVYPKEGKPLLWIEAGRGGAGGEIEILPEKNEIRLYNKERHDSHLGPELQNLKGYYVLKFSNTFVNYGTWKDGEISEAKRQDAGSSVGAYIEFANMTAGVELRVGSSFISYVQAESNLEKEIPAKSSFEKVKKKVKNEWAKHLDKVQIKGATANDLTIFYTAFFRTLQYPREFSEYGKYYSPFDDAVHNGVSYNAYSLWDTFRSQHPWLQLVASDRVNDMVTALVQMYKEGGWIPKWPNPTYTNIMIGTHADAVIADAYVNGFRNYDLETAYQAIRKNAFTPPADDEQHRWGDRAWWNGSYEARGGLTNYIAKGYVAEDKADESVARTLEFALDDYCIAQMAKGLGYSDDYEVLMERSKNYVNLYNTEAGFFQAKKTDGTWEAPHVGFTEGANWTYLFCVMQDVDGMIELMGGKEKFMQMLDKCFDEGHYRHDNEPCHHYAYLYNYCGRFDKTQARIPSIIEKNYKNSADGLSGNDDCGQMSAWYLFSSLGLYPLTPSSGEYTIGIPRFEEVKLDLPNGKSLTVKAPDIESGTPLTTVKFNGKTLDQPFIPIKEVWQGGTLEFLK